MLQLIVPIKNYGEFTEQNRATAESLLRKDAFPQHYTNIEFESLKVEGVKLIPEELIVRDGYGSSQSIRADGLNHKYDEIKTDLLENGYRIYDKLIFVKRIDGGKFALVDGRTKDKILKEKKFKNRICVVVEIDESEEEEYAERLNSGDDRGPAGLIKECDITALAHRRITSGQLELDVNVIRKWIDKVCGQGKFSTKKRSDLAFMIFNHANAIQTSSLMPVAWANAKEVSSWLEGKKYIETQTVIYLPYAASSPIKAFFAAAELAQLHPNKEIRLVIYVSKLNAYNLKKCYLDAVLKFKKMWSDYLIKIGNTYYDGSSATNSRVVLYACVPSNIEDVCDDMEKLIIFGKNDQKINDSYLTNQSLSGFFEEDEEEEDN